MKWIIYTVILLLLLILQLAIAELNLFPSAPNLILVYLAVLMFYIPIKDAAWLTIASGLFLDFFSGLPDGIITFSLVGAVLLAYYLSQMVFTEQLSTFLILFYTIIGSIIFFLLIILSNYILGFVNVGREINFEYLFTVKLGSDVIFNLVFLYPVYWLYQLQSELQFRFLKHESV